MSIHFETYSIPSVLTKDVIIAAEDTAKISQQLSKTNRNLVKKMKAIDRKEKRSWQKSLIRNSRW